MKFTKSFSCRRIFLFSFLAVASMAAAGTYVDPGQLECPWPKHSFYKQPWRSFLEVRSGADFLNGIGVNYHSRGNDEVALRLLAETGVRAYRYEIGWGSVAWDEAKINGQEKHLKVLQLMKQYGARPTLLLNAHHGAPCPMQSFQRKLAGPAAQGARSVRLTDVAGIVSGRTGINPPKDYWAAAVLITAVDPATGECTLSKPLPWALEADKPVKMTTLKYAPMYPVGTPEYEATAAGWVQYALKVCELARAAGYEDFDIEIWNELSFGSNFVNIDNYYEKGKPPYAGKRVDLLNRGGSSWELARRTVEVVKAKYPRVRCIWGWSNTTFYHCAVEKLPAGTDGQSYHPYGTGVISMPKAEAHPDHPEYNLEGYTPKIDIRMSEGWAHTFMKTEGIMRLLNPADRQKKPAGTERFYHYMTEHGVAPGECGAKTEAAEWRVKTYCALRSYCFWLNKGIDVLHYFQAGDNAGGMGILPFEVAKLPADARWSEVATPPMRAIRGMLDCFAGAGPVAAPVKLEVESEAIGKVGMIFEGDGTHPGLSHQDVLAVLPFQTGPRKMVIAVYVMTYDVTRPMPEERYRLMLKGLEGKVKTATLRDPLTGKQEGVKTAGDADGVKVELKVADSPRFLMLEW